jgi:hypothetical protein
LEHKDSFKYLAKIATYQEYWDDDSPHSPWAPICAIHLLAKIGDYKSQLAINSTLVQYHDDDGGLGDFLMDNTPHILAHISNDATHLLALMLNDKTINEYVRNTAARSLVIIAAAHPESKPKVIQAIKNVAQKESNINTRTMLVDSLVDLKDPDLYSYLKDSITTGFITEDFFDLSWLDAIYAEKEYAQCDITPRNPLNIFSNHPTNIYQKTNNHIPPSVYNSKSIGRNDKCPCGSGKKYKKCCMKIM